MKPQNKTRCYIDIGFIVENGYRYMQTHKASSINGYPGCIKNLQRRLQRKYNITKYIGWGIREEIDSTEYIENYFLKALDN